MSKNVRFQMDIPAERMREIEELMKVAGISTKREFFNDAFALIHWVAKQIQEGRSIASIDDENRVVREIVMPMLDQIRTNTQAATPPLT